MELVARLNKKVWDETLIAETAHLNDQQRYLIVNRVLGYLNVKLYQPIIQHAVGQILNEESRRQ